MVWATLGSPRSEGRRTTRNSQPTWKSFNGPARRMLSNDSILAQGMGKYLKASTALATPIRMRNATFSHSSDGPGAGVLDPSTMCGACGSGGVGCLDCVAVGMLEEEPTAGRRAFEPGTLKGAAVTTRSRNSGKRGSG